MVQKHSITPFIVFFSLSLSLYWGCDNGVREIRFIEAAEDFTQVSKDELNFGRQEETWMITLSNDNYQFIRWTASVDASWLSVVPEEGQIIPWGEQSILVSVNRSILTRSEGMGMVTIDIPIYQETKYIRILVGNKIDPSTESGSRFYSR